MLLLALGPRSAAQTPRHQTDALPSAAHIIQKALDWAESQEKQELEKQVFCQYVSTREHLDDQGQVKSREQLLYAVYPIGGQLYYELSQKDGHPLSEKEAREELEKKRKFHEKAAGGKSGKKKEDDNGIEFNEELVNRYRADVLGREEVNGRPAYVLRFEPKSDNLPVRRRIDRALNKSKGKLWIDEEEFAVVRVQFQLQEPVSLWLGILGKIGEMDGEFEQTRLHQGVWFPKTMNLYFKGRVFFKSLHQRRTSHWQDVRMSSLESAGNRGDPSEGTAN